MKITKVMELKKVYLLMIISFFYLTLSLACDPLAFRLVNIVGFVTGAPFFYPILYILLDLMTRIAGRRMAIHLVLLFHLFDFVYTYALYLANLLPAPQNFSHLAAFNTVLSPLPGLFWAGIIGSIIAGIVDVMIFTFLQERIKSFFLSSYITTIIILFAHNIPTDYFALRHIFPNNYWQVVWGNFAISAVSVLIFSAVFNFIVNKNRLMSKVN